MDVCQLSHEDLNGSTDEPCFCHGHCTRLNKMCLVQLPALIHQKVKKPPPSDWKFWANWVSSWLTSGFSPATIAQRGGFSHAYRAKSYLHDAQTNPLHCITVMQDCWAPPAKSRHARTVYTSQLGCTNQHVVHSTSMAFQPKFHHVKHPLLKLESLNPRCLGFAS